MSTITLDLETSGLDWTKDTIFLCGWCVDGGEIKYEITQELKDLLSVPANVLSGHNIKFDALFLANNGCTIGCELEDTRVLAYLNWPQEASHSLKDLVRSRLHKEPTDLSSIQFKPLKKDLPFLEERKEEYFTFSDGKLVRKDLLIDYHREDILNVLRIKKILTPTDWFKTVEMPLTKMLFDMELYGCPLGYDRLVQLRDSGTGSSSDCLVRLGAFNPNPADDLFQKEAFNPDSPKQVQAALTKLGYNLEEIADKTPAGGYSVGKALLKELAWSGDEFSKAMLEYRKHSKILGTYVEPFLENIKFDGRLHGSINQAGSEDLYGDGARGTNTGRLSSSNPNLQNIPSRTKEGKEVRKVFIASKGMHMFDTDLSQIEPRLVAHYTQAPKLLEAFRNKVDTHGLFANDIFGGLDHTNKAILSTNALAQMERFIGKSSWLATVYGCSYKKLLLICENFSENPLELPLERFYPAFDHLAIYQKRKLVKDLGKNYRKTHAQWMFFKNVQDTFEEKNKEIFAWREAHIERTRRIGYVVTLGGRKIAIEGLDSQDFKERAGAERQAVNYLIQGSAADIMKLIMVRAKNEILDKGLGRIFAVVHDELLGELVDPGHIALVKDIMENTVKLRNVNIEASTKLVNNWGEKE